MSEEVKVGISDYKITRNPNKLTTLGLGSCIAIIVYDEKSHLGGLSHIMLPDSEVFKARSQLKQEKFADLALPKMIQEMRQQEPCGKFVAKIAGGASMFNFNEGSKAPNIGERNIIAVTTVLKELKIPLLSSHTGGNMGRSLIVDLTTLSVKVKLVNREIIEL